MGRPPAGQLSDGIRTVEGLRVRCRVDELTDCWIWAGAQRRGSAVVWMPDLGTSVAMGYAVFYLKHGKPPPRGARYVPTCGRALCGNPAHRRLGDCSELHTLLRPQLTPEHRAHIVISSRRAKGSAYTPDLARRVRVDGAPAHAVAEAHGVPVSLVQRIRRGLPKDTVAMSSVFAWDGGAIGAKA